MDLDDRDPSKNSLALRRSSTKLFLGLPLFIPVCSAITSMTNRGLRREAQQECQLPLIRR